MTEPHPRWAPGRGWDEDVAAYLFETADATLLLDPLAADPAPLDEASENEEDERQYRDEFVASVRRWLELPIDHVLVAHGEYVPGGAAELERALERPPWNVT